MKTKSPENVVVTRSPRPRPLADRRRSGLDDNVLNWYEVGLPATKRKQRGHFSTPPALVKKILDACGYTFRADLTGVRVLDPACGSGNFLVEAAHRLLTCCTQKGIDQITQIFLVQRNLWGLDPDPVACFLTELHLRTILSVGSDVERRSREILSAAKDDILSLHIHQADALALPWEPRVDLLLANPPYLAAKNSDLSGYQSTHQRGQADSYLLFLNLALQTLRPGGWMGLVLPDPILARANATREREHLLQEMTVHHLWHLADVFAANVGAVVIIAQKSPPSSIHHVSWVRGKWQNALPDSQQIPQIHFQRQPRAELRYLLNTPRGNIIERLRLHMDEPSGLPRRLAPLSNFLTISRGEELGKNSHFIRQLPDGSIENDYRSYPILLGGSDIRPYAVLEATHCIERSAIVKPLDRYLSPKLLVVKSTDRLQAALDMQEHVALQTLYLLHPRDPNTSEDDLYFFLALLNSRLLCEYVYMLHTAYKWVQPQIEQSVLARLPVPLVAADDANSAFALQPLGLPARSASQKIIHMSRLLVNACRGRGIVVEWKQHDIYEEQERAICALYEAVVPGLFA